MENVVATSTLQDQDKSFEFATGLFGFPNEKRFAIVEIPGGGDMFKQMVSLERPELGFTLVYPFAFFPDYAPDIPDEEALEIGATSPEQVVLMVIAKVPEKFQETTVNLKAPIVFNPFSRKGRQVILTDEQYGTRQPLFKV